VASVALHRFGPGPDYDIWRLTVLDPEGSGLTLMLSRSVFGRREEVRMQQMTTRRRGLSLPAEFGHFTLIHSERNPVALFGAGRIESIPDSALEAAERGTLGVRGRVARMRDGRIGRFGWKAQSPTLDEFVRTACAVELGLEVPGHPQARDPRDPKAGRAARLDLLGEDCDALTEFVRALPGPGRRAGVRDAELVARGESRFAAIGCVACHTPKLGEVDGLYSDLLLHDMGDELGDSGSYNIVTPAPDEESETDGLPPAFPSGMDAFAGPWQRARPASRREWRTPPLWGVRDSAPYLHDGRAATLEQAIAHHGGQGTWVADNYFRLSQSERAELIAFLKSLVAPGTDGRLPTDVEMGDPRR
jgi:CxxC motif-containing protein (DUF1111 family)